jgi:hypothetical protein
MAGGLDGALLFGLGGLVTAFPPLQIIPALLHD